MKNLIRGSIDWSMLGGEKSEYSFELGKGVIHKETGVLEMPIRLNFIIPFLDCEKIKALIINKLDIINEVQFEFTYENLLLDEEQIARLFLPYMIKEVNGSYISITKMIDERTVKKDGSRVIYHALGEFATDQLNEKLARRFQEILKERFDLSLEVSFANNVELFEEMSRSFHANEAKEIEKSVEEYRKEVKARKAAAPKRAENSGNAGFGAGGFQPKGGFGAEAQGEGASGIGKPHYGARYTGRQNR